jgi:hypothetical protein
MTMKSVETRPLAFNPARSVPFFLEINHSISRNASLLLMLAKAIASRRNVRIVGCTRFHSK